MARRKQAEKATSEPSVELPLTKNHTDHPHDVPAPVDLSQATNKRLESGVFFRATAAYQPADQVLFYLYRVWPVIDRKLVDEDAKTHIDKFSHAIDARWLLEKWGSGDYSIYFSDAGRPRGSNKVAWTTLALRDDQHPPVLDQAELAVGDPKNKSYIEGLKARGKWREEEEGDDMGNNAAVTELTALATEALASRGEQVPRQAIDAMAEAHKRSLEMVGNPLGLVKDLLPLLQLNRGGGDTEAVLKLLVETQTRNQELMLKMFESQQRAANPATGLDDSLQQAMKVDTILTRLGRRGDRANANESNWTQYIPLVLAAFQQIAAGFASRQQPQGNVVQMPMPAPTLGHAGPASVVQMPTPAAPPVEQAAVPTLLSIAQQVTGFIQRGFSGADFAMHTCMMHGDDAYEQIRSVGDAATLIQLFASDPAAVAALAPVQAQLLPWIQEFIDYGTPEAPESTQEPAAA